MKKVLSFIGCAIFVAAMSISCGHKNQEEAVDSMIDTTIEENAVQQVAPEMSDAEHAAMIDAAIAAGQAKCNCYKTDAASVEACINSILTESYAAYKDNEEFQARMNEEFESCVKGKVADATKQAVNEGVKAGAKAISEKLSK
ncbi:MAG: hypothetical protein IKR83_01775 [Bacteroidales bacterium]|nr:hypothetical protein [Bacteroidales bacterium]